MKIQLTLTHEKLNGVFYLEKDQIAFVQEGKYWYADVDDIPDNGMERVFEDFECSVNVPAEFMYNDFYRIMMKLLALSILI